ncbi:hypothetical protein D3C86_1746870 [compost metagenome]
MATLYLERGTLYGNNSYRPGACGTAGAGEHRHDLPASSRCRRRSLRSWPSRSGCVRFSRRIRLLFCGAALFVRLRRYPVPGDLQRHARGRTGDRTNDRRPDLPGAGSATARGPHAGAVRHVTPVVRRTDDRASRGHQCTLSLHRVRRKVGTAGR